MNANAKQLPSERHGMPMDSTSSAILDAERPAAKHTTGPWTLDLLAGLNNMLDPTRPQGAPIMAGDKIVCTIPLPDDSGIDGYEQTANARLIAAAPALLEALRELLREAWAADKIYGEAYGESLASNKTWEKARAAISQAEG